MSEKKLLISNKSFILLVLILFIAIFVSACGKSDLEKNPLYCTQDSECISKLSSELSTGKCLVPRCDGNICSVKIKPNCCGNNISEQTEDGKKGGMCTCPEDWGTCNSTVMLTVDSNEFSSKYLRRECDKNSICGVIYAPELEKNIEVFNNLLDTGFNFNIYTTYNSPIDKDNGMFTLEFKLTDLDTKLVSTPIKINELRIMDGNNVLVKATPQMSFSKVQDSKNTTMNIKNYVFVYPENLKDLTLSIDYEYTLVDYNGVKMDTPQRKKFDVPISQVPFVDKTLVK